MSKSLFIAEKPSVAKEFAKVLNVSGNASKGYLESDDYVVTWCVGHLVTMSYPEVYDAALKKWSFQTLPFIPGKIKSVRFKVYSIKNGKRTLIKKLIIICANHI